MHLTDILALRPVPAAAVFLTVTRRCPLTCAHCSTNSLMSSEEHSANLFLRFVESFTPTDRPDLVLLMGGEPLLRPALVDGIVERAHAVGSKVALISGMFFAREARTPPAIARVIAKVDHFTASLDVFHEQQVPRKAVFDAVRPLVDRGQQASFHVVGRDAADPYLTDVIGDIRCSFDDRVPIMVAELKPVGRAQTWVESAVVTSPGDGSPEPCPLAAWPVVTFDGTVVACCNQAIVDGPAPPHLRLGHVADDGWGTIRDRCLGAPMVRAIRLFGPEHVASRYGGKKIACDGYCSTCRQLSQDPAIAAVLTPLMARPVYRFVEQQVVELQRRSFPLGLAAYEQLRWLGYDSGASRSGCEEPANALAAAAADR
ncbi:MAG: radical SAM protein [Chloroflexi bacterium]|nr:radical SAM protein [Chloroflexota bacterium]